MTATTHPLARSRRLFLRETTTLEILRAQYQEQGLVDEALQMERCLDYLGESLRIVERLMGKGEAKDHE